MANYKSKEELEKMHDKALKLVSKSGLKLWKPCKQEMEDLKFPNIDEEEGIIYIELQYREPINFGEGYHRFLSGNADVIINTETKQVKAIKAMNGLEIVDRDITLNAIALFVNRVDNLGQEIAKEFDFKLVG